MSEKQNINPTIYEVEEPEHEKAGDQKKRVDIDAIEPEEESVVDAFDVDEIFDMIRHVNDPEHPLTLEQLKVLSRERITLTYDAQEQPLVDIQFTPTIPHCSMATLIGLCLRVKLLRSIPSRFKVDISITPGTHEQEHAVNKQLNDKERVAAALENAHLLEVVNKCIANTDGSTI